MRWVVIMMLVLATVVVGGLGGDHVGTGDESGVGLCRGGVSSCNNSSRSSSRGGRGWW